MTDENEIPPDRNEQIKLLFRQDNDLNRELGELKVVQQQNTKMLEGINKGVSEMEELNKSTNIALFGSEKLGHEGIISQMKQLKEKDKKQDEEIGFFKSRWREIGVAGFVCLWFVTELGMFDKIFK